MTNEQILAFIIAFLTDRELDNLVDYTSEMGMLIDELDAFDLKHFVYESCGKVTIHHFQEVSLQVYGFEL